MSQFRANEDIAAVQLGVHIWLCESSNEILQVTDWIVAIAVNTHVCHSYQKSVIKQLFGYVGSSLKLSFIQRILITVVQNIQKLGTGIPVLACIT